jgi:hypothetical protein
VGVVDPLELLLLDPLPLPDEPPLPEPLPLLEPPLLPEPFAPQLDALALALFAEEKLVESVE